jgi:ABC-type polar amino acid transport system ATPase subunit
MKISELVTLLQQLQKEHGDINCVCHDTDYSRDEDVSPDVVFYDEELNIVRFMP